MNAFDIIKYEASYREKLDLLKKVYSGIWGYSDYTPEFTCKRNFISKDGVCSIAIITPEINISHIKNTSINCSSRISLQFPNGINYTIIVKIENKEMKIYSHGATRLITTLNSSDFEDDAIFNTSLILQQYYTNDFFNFINLNFITNYYKLSLNMFEKYLSKVNFKLVFNKNPEIINDVELREQMGFYYNKIINFITELEKTA